MVGSANKRIFILSVLFFAVNSIVDYAAIKFFDGNYGAVCKWDCRDWYVTILDGGYHLQSYVHTQSEAANWAFFPLFPLLAGLVRSITGFPADLALVFTAKACFFFAIMAFLKLCHTYKPDINLTLCGAALIASPYAIYANTGYTEPLFLLLTSLSFIFMKQGRFVLSGLSGGALSGVRTVGIAIGFSYLLASIRPFIASPARRLDILLGLMLIPLGLSAYMVFLHHTMGDAMAFSHIQVVWDRSIQNPISVLLNSIGINKVNILYIVNLLLAFFMIVRLYRDSLSDLAIFSLLATLIPLSTGMWSLPRYLWWQAPLIFAVACMLQRKWIAAIVLPLLLAGQLLMYRAWFGGEWYVI